MKKLFIAILFPALLLTKTTAQTDSTPIAKYITAMIPMRDGVKLFTSIRVPLGLVEKIPILLNRTPYGVNVPEDTIIKVKNGSGTISGEQWIWVYQDVRGRHKSQGVRQLHQPITHLTQKRTVDESTDTWDTVDWLIKNLNIHNGKVGLWGASYPGWLALVGAIDPHPALKVVYEVACMADLWLGDDFHHNGAFRLDYSLPYVYTMEKDSSFPFPQYDLYDWYLKLGSLKNVNEKYFHNKIPAWNDFVNHLNYDSFWVKNSPLKYMSYPQIPILHIGGYYDQEDLNGPQLMYSHLEKKDSFNRNFLLLRATGHGGPGAREDSSSGKFIFASSTSDLPPQTTPIKWLSKWLIDGFEAEFPEANCFQTGSNVWKAYNEWPPKNVTIQKLYASENDRCSFTAPAKNDGFISFISDPAKPVPYRQFPIDAPATSSGWSQWHLEDQRFVYTRPDVISFISDSLTEDLTVTGKIIAHLFASTNQTDADWVVKLIDVYPDNYRPIPKMSGYQFPVAMEVFRGRYRKSFSNPSPLVPNKPEEFIMDLHDINHVFRKGHKLMIQVQSTWFPVIDRNPQKYVPNIFLADEKDFINAEHRIYFSKKYPTYIELPVMKE